MRGEHSHPAPSGLMLRGSSPHARGAQVSNQGTRSRWGIIPACAGSTRGEKFESPKVRDHPRMRGEHPVEYIPELDRRGSSPHARGAP